MMPVAPSLPLWPVPPTSRQQKMPRSPRSLTMVRIAAETRPIMEEMRRIFVTLLSRAQAVGAVRTDVGVDEVVALLFGAPGPRSSLVGIVTY